MVMSSGPFTINPGAINTMSFTIFHVKDVAHPCPSTENLDAAAEDVYDLYNEITSVETLNKSLSITLSPNPFSDETLLQLEDPTNQVERLDLYNVSGQLVRSYNQLASNSIVIERGNLVNGMYFYKLVTDKQQYVSGKLFVRCKRTHKRITSGKKPYFKTRLVFNQNITYEKFNSTYSPFCNHIVF